jgi:hypothetical protein
MLPVLRHPVRHLAKLLQFRPAIPVPTPLLHPHQPTIRQQFDMQRNGLLAHVESLRKRLDIQRPSRDQLNDRPPGGIGYRLVYVSPLFHNIQVIACEIKHKYSLVQNFFYLSPE